MEKEKFDQAAKIQQQMNALKMIQDRVDNEKFVTTFGVSIHNAFDPDGPLKPPIFCPIADEGLNEILRGITKQYCEQKMAALKDEFNVV